MSNKKKKTIVDEAIEAVEAVAEEVVEATYVKEIIKDKIKLVYHPRKGWYKEEVK